MSFLGSLLVCMELNALLGSRALVRLVFAWRLGILVQCSFDRVSGDIQLLKDLSPCSEFTLSPSPCRDVKRVICFPNLGSFVC